MKLELNSEEYNRLLDLAIIEMRSLPDQARYMLRQALFQQQPLEKHTGDNPTA